jgi:hypothetical protein
MDDRQTTVWKSLAADTTQTSPKIGCRRTVGYSLSLLLLRCYLQALLDTLPLAYLVKYNIHPSCLALVWLIMLPPAWAVC